MKFLRQWHRGPRTTVEGTDTRGHKVTRLGKNGGPVITQTVELRLIPKENRS